MKKLRILSAVVIVLFATREGSAQQQKPIDLTPQSVKLKTRDGVHLTGRYFPGRHGSESIPVIILHGLKERASTYEAFAEQLQSDEFGGHAVFVPDLRGHGGSTELEDPVRDRVKKLSADKLVKNDFLAMVQYDIDRVKAFLLERHNAGELNIDMLTVVGSEMGSVLALYWAAQDWSWPPLRGLRQGQDVKALVLISPPKSLRGLNVSKALESEGVQREISMMLVYGKEDRVATSNAKRLYGLLQKNRKQKWASDEERKQNQNLFIIPLRTSLQGSQLLRASTLKVPESIREFIDARLQQRAADYPWEERVLPAVGT